MGNKEDTDGKDAATPAEVVNWFLPSAEARDHLHIIMSAIPEVKTRWLWQGRIPLRAITILDGDPGLGKSLLTLDLIARLTTGRPMPDGTPSVFGTVPANALLLSAEDDLATTIRPRLRAAGADLDWVAWLGEAMYWKDDRDETNYYRPLRLPRDIDSLERAVEVMNANLVVIDPLTAFLEEGVNSWRDSDVRAALAPVMDLAQRGWLAVVAVRHLNKAQGANALYRGGGSIGIIGAARSGLLVAKSPDDPEHERILAATKSNLGPPMPALRYRIQPAEDGTPRVEWLGPSPHTASQLLRPPDENDEPSAEEEAMEFLRAALADGERLVAEVEAEARQMAISSRTLKRGRVRLGVRKRREGFGAGGRWYWSLPPAPGAAGDATDMHADAGEGEKDTGPPADARPAS
jgi:AAA domain-containing protein